MFFLLIVSGSFRFNQLVDSPFPLTTRRRPGFICCWERLVAWLLEVRLPVLDDP
jgi:hypothetical protein